MRLLVAVTLTLVIAGLRLPAFADQLVTVTTADGPREAIVLTAE